MLIDIELFLYEKFEKDEHYSQGGNIPVEGYPLEGVDQTVQDIAQLVHQVAVNKGSVADHYTSYV
jgi:hypothetical protein